jgi:cell division protein FtsB
LKQTARRALVLLLFANFVGYATIGSNGILRWSGYHSQKDERIGELALLDAELARLAHHNDLLDPMSADPDLVEEMIRTQLGLVRPDEVIILTR